MIGLWLFKSCGSEDDLDVTNKETIETKQEKEADQDVDYDTGTLDGFLKHITSNTFKASCEYSPDYKIIEFRTNNTYSLSEYNKRREVLLDSTTGTFEIGEIKFVDAEEGTFRYLRLDEEDWRVFTVSSSWGRFNGKGLISLLKDLDIKGATDFDGYDEYGPLVWSNSISLAWECDRYEPIE